MIKLLNKESRLAMLKQAPQALQEMYGSEENAQVISKVAELLGISDDNAYDTLALTVGDIILGAHPKEFLGQMLKDRMGLTEEQIIRATTELSDFLNKIPTQKIESPPIIMNTPTDESLLSGLKAVDSVSQSNSIGGNEVKPIRTFAEDVEYSRVHGYGAFHSEDYQTNEGETPIHRSSQDDIIK